MADLVQPKLPEGEAPPFCQPCRYFAEYELRRDLWTCPLCGRRVTAQVVAIATGRADG